MRLTQPADEGCAKLGANIMDLSRDPIDHRRYLLLLAGIATFGTTFSMYT